MPDHLTLFVSPLGPTTNKTSASVSQVETSYTPPSNTSIEMPRVESVRPSRVIIEDWYCYGKWVTADKAQQGNPQQALKYKGMFDSRYSRHMIGNKALLTDYQDIVGGFVAFGGSTRGGKITCIGKIKTNKIDFEDVFFVKELKFNLFSVSQMCDNKNNVLFIETKCLVLSPDFKLIDESQVLLRVPRQNNMYNFDLKNVVPTGDLTCLFAKAIINESKLWHKRLGRVNFKTMNKLMKGNLVRGLPSKTFKNDHTCIACKRESNTKPPVRPNMEIDEFCGQKGIKREYSIARTPQQNGVAERKNRTLIEAARTMLADSLLPTASLMGKGWNRFFSWGTSVKYKAIRVFNSKPEKLKRMCHVNFLENKPNVAGQGPNWIFDIDSLTNSMNYQPVTAGNQTNKNAGPQEANGNTDPDDKAEYDSVDDDACKRLYKNKQREKITKASSTNSFNTVSTPVNTASASRTFSPIGPSSGPSFIPFGGSFLIDVANLPHDPLMTELEDTAEIRSTGIFGNAYDDHDLETLNTLYADQSVGAEADFNNMEPSTVVSPIPTTRVHYTHQSSGFNGDPKPAVQTRGLTKKNLENML
ncbi:ribonuclease H-like domain-containing protein [Tanacetum coccineum]